MVEQEIQMTAALRVAIVGSGPAGFYAAGHILKAVPGSEVEMFDRLATPWGLVRSGVAPDHPKIKAVTRVFEKTARQDGFRFHGNVTVGRDVSHAELLSHHHAVLYAVGSASDRRLGIDGEDLHGSLPATAFVGWYNGHPDFAELDPDLSSKRVVVVGNGNVAIDVARMMVLGHDELAVTDIADHALELLDRSEVEEVVVLGRRGPAQAAFTNPELLELGELADADVIVYPEEIELDPRSRAWLESDEADITSRRNVEILQEYAQRTPSGRRKRIVLRFLSSPLEILGEERVSGVRIGRNELDENLRARATGQEETIEAGLVLRSVGYRGEPLDGLPFDERSATISNEKGRVVEADSRAPLPGVYTAGWIKRGPSGVIGTNKRCAQETVDELLEDREAGRLPQPTRGRDGLIALLHERNPHVVDYAGWEAIDAHERSSGEALGRPRVKVVRHEHFIELAGRGARK
ncbi:MAG: FAD-dependent pyridine nucleotide-disulfide oxidoreductase [Conexibacter sp.]|nr:FAD-dependent pyridine nucleotide-disulfide oxidoreductase [Conexibacter sp.]